MRNQIKLGLALFLIIVGSGIAFAGVTRSIGSFNCPTNTQITFQVSGVGSFCGIYEYIPNTWSIVSTSPVAQVASYGSDNQLQFGLTSDGTARYTVSIPNPDNYDDAYNNNPHLITKGEFSIDGGAITQVSGPSSFNVRKHSCDPGVSGNYLGAYDDEDADGWGAGCACPGPDCNDQNPNINPGHAEIWCNNIDDNCDNRECCSQQQYAVNQPNYYDGTGTDAGGVWVSTDSNYHVCNGLQNPEKRKFMDNWLSAQFDAALNVVGNNVPTDYSNN